MIKFFNTQWDAVPVCCVDTETTGIRVGKDKAVSVALVRFEKGAVVDSFASFVNPGFQIPAEATEIHKITDAAVAGAPMIHELFADSRVIALLEGAQPAAYNGPFDKHFVPAVRRGLDLAVARRAVARAQGRPLCKRPGASQASCYL